MPLIRPILTPALMTLTELLTSAPSDLPHWRKTLRQSHGLETKRSIIAVCGNWSENLSHLASYYPTQTLLEHSFRLAKALAPHFHLVVLDYTTDTELSTRVISALASKSELATDAYSLRPHPPVNTERETPTLSESELASLLGADLVIAEDIFQTACDTRGPAGIVVFSPPQQASSGIHAFEISSIATAIQQTILETTSLAGRHSALAKSKQQQNAEASRQYARLIHDFLMRLAPSAITDTQPSPPPVWKTLLGVETIEATTYHSGERKELVELSLHPIRCALDIGCAAGGTGAYIKETTPGARVIGVETNRAAAKIAKTRLDAVLIGKFEEVDLGQAGIRPGDIDTVIVGDVLEHMYDPWSVLTSLLPWLSADAQIITSIPNVRNLKLMEAVAAGYWRYEAAGLLDVTHIRFFTLHEIRRFFHETGYHIRKIKYGIDPRLFEFHRQHHGLNTPLDIHLGKMSLHGVEQSELNELCSLQFFLVAGINARIEDVEHYQATPFTTRLLQRFALTPPEEKDWQAYFSSSPSPSLAAVHLFLIDTSTDLSRLSRTAAELLKQHYPAYHTTVISSIPQPEILSQNDAFRWVCPGADESHFAVINRHLAETPAAWCGVIFSGDTLEPGALLKMMEIARTQADVHCIYGDDSVGDLGQPGPPHLKPDFDLALLLGTDYLGGGLTLFKTAWLQKQGGFAADKRGAEILDAALRLFTETGKAGFAHLAEPILHRPIGGNDGDLPFSQVVQSRRQAIDQFFQTLQLAITIEDGWLPGSFRMRPALKTLPPVSILIVAGAESSALPRCIESLLEKTQYPNFEILILDNGVSDEATRQFLTGIDDLGSQSLQVFKPEQAVSTVTATNLLATQATGEVLVILDDGILPTMSSWLSELVSLLTLPEVAALSPRILTADGNIRHSGLIAGIDRACIDAFSGLRHNEAGIFGRAHLCQRFSTLPDACVVMRKEVFSAAGGLDDEHTESRFQAMADLGLRLTEAGLTCVWTPFVSLLGPSLRTNENEKSSPFFLPDSLLERHLPLLSRDPAYHPAFSLVPPLFTYEPRLELVSKRCRAPNRPLPKFLANYADRGGCGYYRIIEPSKILDDNGFAETEATSNLVDTVEIERIRPDTLIMQRQITDLQLERLERIRKINRTPLCYELDDLIFDLPKDSPHIHEMPADIEMRLRRGIACCDRLIVSTEPLARALNNMCADIRIVPNYLTPERWLGLTQNQDHGTKPRVGWSGSISHAGDLKLIESVVRELANEIDWIFMGLAPSALKPYIAEYHPGLPFNNYPQAMANMRLDLALAPLELCRFNECKSNLKLLEYGVLAYPVIATDILPYQCGLPVTLIKNTPKQWIQTIREHLADRAHLAHRGRALQAAVLKDWMLDKHASEWLSAWTL